MLGHTAVLMSDFWLANNRELNTTFAEAINQFRFREGSSWRIHTTSVNNNQKRKSISGEVAQQHLYLKCASLSRKGKTILSQREYRRNRASLLYLEVHLCIHLTDRNYSLTENIESGSMVWQKCY